MPGKTISVASPSEVYMWLNEIKIVDDAINKEELTVLHRIQTGNRVGLGFQTVLLPY